MEEIMTKCINNKCELKNKCGRYDAKAGFKEAVLYPDGGKNCGQYIPQKIKE
jgi:hypothetical protein